MKPRQLWRSVVAALLSASVMTAELQAQSREPSAARDAANGALVGAVIGGVAGAFVFLAITRRPMRIEPSRLDFSTVKIGDTAHRVVEIGNRTGGPMTVTMLSSSNAAFSIVRPRVPFEIQPHSTSQLTLSFKPQSPERTSATIQIDVTAPQRARPPRPKIPVTGLGVR